MSDFTKGDRVIWHDPDPDAEQATNTGVIVCRQANGDPDDVVTVSMDDGGLVEAFPHELEQA